MMDWARHKSNWPNAELSRFVDVKPHRWHLQQAGEGQDILLLHGAGGSLHTWADLIPALTSNYRMTAIDLPGQGFSKLGDRARCGIDPMTDDIARLLDAEDIRPDVIIGHSAGAAIALNLTFAMPTPPAIIALNAAIDDFPGVAGVIFPIAAKLLAMNPATAPFFSLVSSSPERVKRLIASTGSTLPKSKLDRYQALISDSGHVGATLAMMSQWSLDKLRARLPEITSPVVFLAGAKDTAVRPETSTRSAQSLPNATATLVPDLGHLMHEEDPETLNTLILDALAEFRAHMPQGTT